MEVALDLHVSSNLKEQHGILPARLAGQASSVLWWHELVMDATFLGMVGYELLEPHWRKGCGVVWLLPPGRVAAAAGL